MRRCFALLALCFLTVRSFAAIALVQHGTANGTNVGMSITLGSAPTNGNTLLLCYGSMGSSQNVTSVSETGVTWSLLERVHPGATDCEVWIGSVASSASATMSITFNNAGPCQMSAMEFSAVAASPLDQFISNNGTGTATAQTSSTATTLFSNELWVNFFVSSGQLSAPTSSYASVDAPAAASGVTATMTAYRVVSSKAVAGGNATTAAGVDDSWVAMAVTLKDSVQPGGGHALTALGVGG